MMIHNPTPQVRWEGERGGGSLEYLVCALEHENGVGDLEGGA